jgi:hypothetical protein
MATYLLAVHTGGESVRRRTSDEDRARSWQEMLALEEDMVSSGAWVFSGHLTEPDTATVVRVSEGEAMMTDGPFVETKEHIAGYYVIEAEDLDAALRWAARVTAVIGVPIEVRPFAATGRIKDQAAATS